MDLEPIDPETALELYLAAKESEYAASTVRSHRSRLDFFVRWCAEHGIDNLNDLTGRRLHEFRLWRREVGDLSPASEKTQLDTLRVFVRWLGTIDGCDPDLHCKVRSPGLTPAQNTRDVMLDAEWAEPTLAYLERFHYASRRQVVLALLWHTMLRMGSARAIDLRDYHPDEGCVLTGIEGDTLPDLVHVLPRNERQDLGESPESVLVLNALHHRTFDRDNCLRVTPGFDPSHPFLRETVVERAGEQVSMPVETRPRPGYFEELNARLAWL
jgi:integrase